MSAADSSPIVLVDGSSYLYRAYHALPPFTTSSGQPTGAMKGVISMLKSLQKTYPSSAIVVIFDAKGKTFRDELFPAYKANRPAMPDDLRLQIAPLHKTIEALGFPLVVEPGVEADDVIGTYCQQATELGRSVVVSTGDKDMAQLVKPGIELVNTMTNTLMNTEVVIDKFGVRPEQIIDFLALVGDKVDNIPGVDKCGPKTAVKWLSTYGTLQQVIAHADEVKGKIGENLRNALSYLPLSYELATIKCDLTLGQPLHSLHMQQPKQKELVEIFTEFEFKTWLNALDESEKLELAAVKPVESTHYATITDSETLAVWIKKIRNNKQFVFDTETTGLDVMSAKIVGLSIAITAYEAAYIPLMHDYIDAPEQLAIETVLSEFKLLLEDENIIKIGQNLKYDQHILMNHGIKLKGRLEDTMLMSYILNPSAHRHDMDTLSKRYLDHEAVHFEDIAGKGKKQLTFNQIEVEKASFYAAEDADVTLRLHQVLKAKLEAETSLLSVYETIEIPLLSILMRIERNGCLLDKALLAQQSQLLSKSCEQFEQEAHSLAGEEFNLDSPKQLQYILFEKLAIPATKKTPKGQPSTAEPVLQELAKSYPLPKLIITYRSLKKLKTTYTDALPLQINDLTGRVHTSYNQAVTATGRLSSKNPNLQNIPIKNEEGRKIRQAFIAPKNTVLLAADYSQIELRIMAHLSQDQGLLSAFQHNQDVHTSTAAEVFGVALYQVTSEQRRNAKAINFGLIYGMSAFGLSQQLGVNRNEAQVYVDAYFERFSGVKTYMETIKEQAKSRGFVETLLGRRLYLPEINARNALQRQAAERTAINAPMQGTAADIIKKAMISIDQSLVSYPHVKMIMQVHDELVFEVPKTLSAEVTQMIKENMETAVILDVPLVVEVGIGKNWDQAH